jgi:HK97 family phage portal protein
MRVLTAQGGYQDVASRSFLDGIAGGSGGPFNATGQGRVPLAGKPTGETMWASYSDIYRHNPWCYGAVNTINRGLSNLPLQVFLALPDGDRQQILADVNASPGPLSDQQRLARLLRAPEPRVSWNRLMKRAMWNWLIKGNTLIEKVRGPDGKIIALKHWPWRYVMPARYGQYGLVYGGWSPGLGPIVHWLVWEVPSWDWRIILPMDAIHIHYGDQEDGELGVSPLEPVAKAHGLQDAMGRQLMNWFANGANPSLHVKVAKKPSDPEQKWLEAQFNTQYGGPENAGKTIFSTGDPTPLSTAPAANAVTEITKISREEMFAALGVPPVLMGVLEKAALGNVKELRSWYLRDLVGPYATTVEDEVFAQLITDPAEPNWAGLFSLFDLDSRLRPDLQELATAQAALVAGTLQTPNEGRRVLNKPRSTDPSADQLWGLVTTAPIKKLAAAAVAQPTPEPAVEPNQKANGKAPALAK